MSAHPRKKRILNLAKGKKRQTFEFTARFDALKNALNSDSLDEADIKEAHRYIESNHYLQKKCLTNKTLATEKENLLKSFDEYLKSLDASSKTEEPLKEILPKVEGDDYYLSKPLEPVSEHEIKPEKIGLLGLLRAAKKYLIISAITLPLILFPTEMEKQKPRNVQLENLTFIEQISETNPKYDLIVYIPQFKLAVYKNRRQIREFKIAAGKPASPTPLGEFEIQSIESWGGAYAGTWMKFLSNKIKGKDWGGWGVHGYYADWPIGYAVTKGCIRMKKEDAEWLKKTISKGVKLTIKYDTINFDQWKRKLTVYPDIYSKGTNNIKAVIEELRDSGIPLQKIKKEKLAELLEKVGVSTLLYTKAANEQYAKIIHSLTSKRLYPKLLEQKPKMKEYLRIMSDNWKKSVSLSEILTEEYVSNRLK